MIYIGKLNICIFLTIFVTFLAFVVDGGANEVKWELVGEIDDGKMNLYVNSESVLIDIAEKKFSFIGKRTLSVKGKILKRKDFEESVNRAEKETGSKIEDKDLLFEKVIIPMSERHDKYEINCLSMEIRRFPPHAPGTIGLVIVDKIIEGSTEFKIYQKYCKDLEKKI